MFESGQAMNCALLHGDGPEFEVLGGARRVMLRYESSMGWIPNRQNFVPPLATRHLATDRVPPKHLRSNLRQQLRKSGQISMIETSVWKVGFSAAEVQVEHQHRLIAFTLGDLSHALQFGWTEGVGQIHGGGVMLFR